jgi:hypothetical protein
VGDGTVRGRQSGAEERNPNVSTETTIPTLTSYHEAVDLLHEIGRAHEWVSVFWDRGWGDSGQRAEISIIADGDGQEPKAWITGEVYRELLDAGTIAPNSYGGYKARRLHDFKTPPKPEKTGPAAGEVAEQVIRDLMGAHSDKPIRAEFYRGLKRNPGGRGSYVDYEIEETPAVDVDGRRVLLLPGHSEVAMSAQESDFLGPHIIGGGIADVLAYPTAGDGEVDVEALRGDAFRATLLAAIDQKVAVIEATRAKVG